jgi:homoserine dehydrogenase
MQLNVAMLGFGNVGRALAELLIAKSDVLRRDYDLNVRVVGISTGRHGHVIDRMGLNLRTALDAVRHGSPLSGLHQGRPIEDSARFLSEVPADLVFETIPTNPHDGQPALSLDRNLLERGIHVVTATKGPVAFGYRDLTRIAAHYGVGFFFESSVMDGAPTLGIGREGLPAADVKRVRGIFNSTTNYILTRMERDSLNFEDALAAAQEIGIAETDPTLDIDGWDSAIKTVILANVLMGADLRPADVDRQGIRGMALEEVQAATVNGERIRLICEASRGADGSITARVAPQRVPMSDILANVTGTSSIVDYETDVLPRLTVIENDPGPTTTAYGLLADMINIVRGRHEAVNRQFQPEDEQEG